ncbi:MULTISPECIES: RnfH family protein [unclassified Agarivorans]|uniref:RnfH family protein n=1 Tax=unclassified Agarivorans TaxID=2636026 RepID=UPI0026E1C4C6|nr:MULTISPECIES: RnfH family protein [unclassified Agarivorans]MDO6685946.1 RnfH family protein [Agarivorans sp. 3_MG-2023]MDO6713916.1 RnfH family protein [Agarivorans sp. 2_MG-2023]MDO6762248.1 RnfH family protein [Agarivorans sp. 1_MG-2023]
MLVSIAYATPQQQLCINVDVVNESSVINALHQSGILDLCPEIQLEKQKVGVFGKFVTLESQLVAGDRVEIYRPITWSPPVEDDDDEDD